MYVWSSSSPQTFEVHDDRTCPECGRQFSNAGCLMRHRLVAHPLSFEEDTRKICGTCGQTFKSTRDRNVHLLEKHHIGDPKVCNKCGKQFYYRKSFRQHVAKVCPGGGATPSKNAIESDQD